MPSRTVTSFDDMGLREEVLRGIYSFGFEKPSMIQQRAIVPIISGTDTIAQAQSGTGKTGAFAVAVLQRVQLEQKHCQVLILSPTRELASQSETVVRAIGCHLPGFPVRMPRPPQRRQPRRLWGRGRSS